MKLQLLAKFSQQFENIVEIFHRLNISYYLLGAQVRDIHLREVQEKSLRKTNDIDFAVMLKDKEDYDNIKIAILESGYKETQNPIKFSRGEGENTVEIDLLPFTDIHNLEMQHFITNTFAYSIVGYSEVSKFTEIVEYLEGKNINVASIAGLVVLKLVAWSENIERQKDLEDFHSILLYYFDKEEKIDGSYIDILDDLSDDNFKAEAGAYMLGRKIGLILSESENLYSLIYGIFEYEINQEVGKISRFFLNKAIYPPLAKNLTGIKRIFELLIKGINSNS